MASGFAEDAPLAGFGSSAGIHVPGVSVKLSLVICTRNRGSRLAPCLAALAGMHKPAGFELVFVDNGSTDETPRVLREFKEKADFPVLIREEPVAGLARARNAGWRAASGEIVAFTDDDCHVAEDFADQVIAVFNRENIDYFAGRILLHDPEDYPITVQLRTRERLFLPGQFIVASRVQGANFGFRRRALIECGGFNERLGAGTPFPSEDIEIVGRLSARRKRGIYSPGPVVSHHHRRRAGPQIDELRRQYDAGRGAYYMAMLLTPGMRLRTLLVWAREAVIHSPMVLVREISAARRYRRMLAGELPAE